MPYAAPVGTPAASPTSPPILSLNGLVFKQKDSHIEGRPKPIISGHGRGKSG